MSVDIIEIALTCITDGQDFEKLANEVMGLEGYPGIIPLGGSGDDGRDAVHGQLYESKQRTYRTVFQHTLEEDTWSKVRKTVTRLQERDIDFAELVLVTPRKITAARLDRFMTKSREELGVSLRIYERKALVNKLADYNNGLFHRHFPNLEQQMHDLQSHRVHRDSETNPESLRAAITYTLGRRAELTRQSLFDNLTLSIALSAVPDAITIEGISAKISVPLSDNQSVHGRITEATARLAKQGLVKITGTNVRATEDALVNAESACSDVDESRKSLVWDLVEKIEEIYERNISVDTRRNLARNIGDVLERYLRLIGAEITAQFSSKEPRIHIYLDGYPALERAARNDVPSALSSLLLDTFAEMIEHPTAEQAMLLADCSLAFLALQIMNLDPELSELKRDQLRSKIFILDTDFLLDCIVTENPISLVYRKVLDDLLSLNCRVIIPEACFEECLNHARFSIQTYRYFGGSLLQYSEEFVEQSVWNVFVKGYYRAWHEGTIPRNSTYESFLREYFDRDHPHGYFSTVVESNLPAGVEVLNPTTLLSAEIPNNQLRDLEDKLLNAILNSRKGQYRLLDENRELAHTDARLFLSALHLGRQMGGQDGRVFGGKCYLITSAARYLRSAAACGIRDEVSTRPQAIASLLNMIGMASLTKRDMVELFENPFVISAVKESKEDVRRLVESGVDLRGAGLTRLRWDLKGALHAQLATVARENDEVEIPQYGPAGPEEKDALAEMLVSVKAKGYKIIPEIERLMQLVDRATSENANKDARIRELKESLDDIESKFAFFGKRKEKYLRRMSRRSQS